MYRKLFSSTTFDYCTTHFSKTVPLILKVIAPEVRISTSEHIPGPGKY